VNNQVDHVVEEAKQLSYEDLKAASERILDMLDEMEWDAIVAKPHVQKRLSELGDKSWQEHLEGLTEEGGFDCK
jgi:hypothetical protein